tara:strand:- start:186 stop:461 length:276 start_codon:yes stop_codon:yes gene_type:complete
MQNNMWIPEIFYEEDSKGLTGGLPFVNVPSEKSMPACMFMCEVRPVKEEDSEVEKEVIVHSLANMTTLKQNLDFETYNKVRKAIGLTPLEK